MTDAPKTPTTDATQTEAPALVPGSAEYNAAMIAKVDAQVAAPVVDKTPEVPAVPEKVAEEVTTEKPTDKIQVKGDEVTPDEKKEEKPTEPPADKDPATKVDFDSLFSRVAESGAISEDDYKSLEGAGISRAMADNYLEGQKALAELRAMDIRKSVGGDEAFAKVVSWAATSGSPDTVETYNSAIDRGDIKTAKVALQALNSQMNAAIGTEPTLVTGATGTSSGDVFRSVSEMTKAMRDPRYNSDPAYRADVAAKLNRSNIF